MMPRHSVRDDCFNGVYRSPRGVHRRETWHVCRFVCLLSIAVLLVSIGAVSAESQAPDDNKLPSQALSHFNGLHTLSGASYRAFKNRLKRQLRGQSCLRYHEAGTWWHYEWCLDQHVRQFHPLPTAPAGSKTRAQKEESVILGRYNSEKPRPLRVLAVENLERLTDPDRMGYFTQQRYDGGDYCEARGGPRSAMIQVKCCAFRGNETYVDALEERSPCEYELSVCSPVACGLMQRDQFVLTAPTSMGNEEREALAHTVRDMFYHAYNGYLTHAFPQDDLLPLSCRGGEFELGRLPMLTLIDTLDTLAILEDAAEFQRAVGLVAKHADFNLDTEVSVFETTIRVLGGLLSAHQFAVNSKMQLFPPGEYDDALLRLAVDLGDRLMPAFDTATGIPYGTVNLRHGVPKGETPIASTAGAGSLSVEFTMLSVLTEDAKYAAAARGAVRALYQRRSKIGLLGKHINTKSGEWTESSSGPGSNSDSFYEYLLKMYALFGDQESLEMFAQVYPAVLVHNKHGDWYTDVSMYSGCHHHSGSSGVVFESLASFWPGMQVGVGDIGPAAESMNAFYRVWRDYGFLSEQFNVGDWKPVRSRGGGGARYPLRPELIESTFYMHEATNDSSWLRAGAHVVHSLQKYCKTSCGYASIADVETKKQEDYMPSFFLSETCKYLYLLFNTTHFFREGNYVMTTEAHPLLILPTNRVGPILAAADAHESSVDAISVQSNRFAPERVLSCKAPSFYDAVGYSVHYEGKVVSRTRLCSPPKPSPVLASVKAAKAAADKMVADSAKRKKNKSLDTESIANDVLEQWVPAIEEKLRKLGDDKGANHGWLEDLVNGNGDLAVDTSWLDQPSDTDNIQGPLVQFLYGGSKLGEFRVEQLPGRMRVTREDTGDWVEVSGVVETSHMIVAISSSDEMEAEADADSYTFDEPKSKSNIDNDLDYLPPPFAWNHVYKVEPDLTLPVDQRCTLQIQMGYKLSADKAQYNVKGKPCVELGEGDKPTTRLSVPCVGAGFGVADNFQSSRAFPNAGLVVADPPDACSEVSNLPEEFFRGKMVLAHRGGCYFEIKARNAAKWGASGIIIINNEDDDVVMVMGGVAEEDQEVGEKPVQIPVVMIPQRLGEWFETRLAEVHASSLASLRVGVELAVRHHERRADSVQRRSRRLPGHSDFPRVEGTANHMKVYGPVWGVELVTMNKEKDENQPEEVFRQESFTITIIGTPPWQR
ncbi:hypothetical protein PHYBOEH_002600 [Phytophthora boehmeriae]|uniref:MRH domain-containing protein n=1 Tax=Phytophthora boehmeriae TaxID=109152 RepID=A0A8T1WXC7_9STRA|nr:hypothetical protein PHYBOEH_002600 [Phytophthora boehmeriae]